MAVSSYNSDPALYDREYSLIDFEPAPLNKIKEDAPFPFEALRYASGQNIMGISEKILALGSQEYRAAPQPAILNSSVRPTGLYTVVSSGTDEDAARQIAAQNPRVASTGRIIGMSDRPAPILYQTAESLNPVQKPEQYTDEREGRRAERDALIPYKIKALEKEVENGSKNIIFSYKVPDIPIFSVETGERLTNGNNTNNNSTGKAGQYIDNSEQVCSLQRRLTREFGDDQDYKTQQLVQCPPLPPYHTSLDGILYDHEAATQIDTANKLDRVRASASASTSPHVVKSVLQPPTYPLPTRDKSEIKQNTMIVIGSAIAMLILFAITFPLTDNFKIKRV